MPRMVSYFEGNLHLTDALWQAGQTDKRCGLVWWHANARPAPESLAITVIETHLWGRENCAARVTGSSGAQRVP
jgi:hypothetical protein